MQDTLLDGEQRLRQYRAIRQFTEKLCRPLITEDYVIQSIEEVSPPKWHLAHTSWFFETFVLLPHFPNYVLFDPIFPYLFNSYYQTVGTFFPRMHRGLLSRPPVEQVFTYRQYVDQAMTALIHLAIKNADDKLFNLIVLGLNHEQQHQELLLTDIKHNFSLDPAHPVYHPLQTTTNGRAYPLEFIPTGGGLFEIGHHSKTFCFDNELPRHKIFLSPYSISSRLVSNADYLEFIQAGGYQDPQWWLSDGWEAVQKNGWRAPLYWQQIENDWWLFTLSGLQPLDVEAPVVHVSFYEAEAYARFKSARLPSEAEWEHFIIANQLTPEDGHFVENEIYHPMSQPHPQSMQFFGDAWEWTNSAYLPYPGYQALHGALGEYNGKFMSNQMVLRGGSCVTSQSHMRTSYRNFFQPDKRWQFSSIRLAKNL